MKLQIKLHDGGKDITKHLKLSLTNCDTSNDDLLTHNIIEKYLFTKNI